MKKVKMLRVLKVNGGNPVKLQGTAVVCVGCGTELANTADWQESADLQGNLLLAAQNSGCNCPFSLRWQWENANGGL